MLIRLLKGFASMIRWPNLFFIALAQILFQFCIYHPIYEGHIPAGDGLRFWYLLAGSLFIAAGGYVINDYFDENIDEVNRPASRIIGKVIARRWAIVWHGVFSAAGLYCTWLSLMSPKQGLLLFLNVGAVLLLWFYSTRFKKSLLIGNILIALLVSWSVLVIFLSKLDPSQVFRAPHPAQLRLFRFAVLYAGFAFLATMARELVKDVEDKEGDRRFGGRTLPIVWGVPVAKLFTAIWLLLLALLLSIVSVYLLQLQLFAAFLYIVLLLFIPLLFLLRQLNNASTTSDFANISRQLKWLQLAGILSMLLFYF